MKASDRGRNVKSKQLFGCFDKICIRQSGGIHVVNTEEEKGKAVVGRICRKGRFKPGMKE